MNKLSLIVAAGLTVASFGFGTAAFAQAAPDFATADTNHDGFVDLAEAQVAYPNLGQQAFEQADTNKDDKLDAAEYGALGGQQSVVDKGASKGGDGTAQGGNTSSSK